MLDLVRFLLALMTDLPMSGCARYWSSAPPQPSDRFQTSTTCARVKRHSRLKSLKRSSRARVASALAGSGEPNLSAKRPAAIPNSRRESVRRSVDILLLLKSADFRQDGEGLQKPVREGRHRSGDHCEPHHHH